MRLDKNRIITFASLILMLLLLLFALLRDTTTPISQQKLDDLIADQKIEKIQADGDSYYITTSKEQYSILSELVDLEKLRGFVIERSGAGSFLVYLLFGVLAIAVVSIATRYLLRRRAKEMPQAVLSTTQSTQTLTPLLTDVQFDDIGGIGDVKEELEEIIDFLKNPKKYTNFGARLPRGVLLVGPPGVGKTMIAKAVATEASVPFYYQSAASFVQIYVGMGAKRVKELFETATKNSPAIIFIDEIDAVGRERSSSNNQEREATLNQLLVQMDGFTDSSSIIVIAATNKIDVLDPALLRSGRFDRRIFVDLPTPSERVSIVSKYLQKIPHDLDADEISKITVGFNGAALATLINEAALNALRTSKDRVTFDDILLVKDKVVYGKKRVALLDEMQREYRALYLAGKAVVAAHFDLEFEKVLLGSQSIKPSLLEPLMRSQIVAHVSTLLSGKIATHMRFGEHASNAKADIEQAISLAKTMLYEYGMGKEILSSEEELAKLLDDVHKSTEEILTQRASTLKRVSEALLKDESVTKEQISEWLI